MLKTKLISPLVIIMLSIFFSPQLSAIDEILLADRFEVGPGVSTHDSAFNEQESTTTLFPIFVIKYEDFYAEGDRAALTFNHFEEGGFIFWTEVIGMYRQQGFLDSTGVLSDLNDRYSTIDMGLGQVMVIEDVGLFTLSLLHDVLNAHQGYEWALTYQAPIVLGNFIIRPEFSVQSMSSNLSNYYFGVSSSEVVAGRSAYAIDQAINYSMGYDMKYIIDDHWRITHSLMLKTFDTSIVNSPIVNTDRDLQFSFSLLYDLF